MAISKYPAPGGGIEYTAIVGTREAGNPAESRTEWTGTLSPGVYLIEYRGSNIDAIGMVFRQGTTTVLGTNITPYFLVDLDQVVDNIQVYGLAENDVIAIARQKAGILNTDGEYDTSASWTYLGDFAASLGAASAADMQVVSHYGDYIYFLGNGGWNVSSNQTLARFDTSDNSCSVITTNFFGGSKNPPFGIQVGSSVYLSPGSSTEFYVYDMATASLSTLATKPTDTAIGTFWYDSVGGKVYNMPGYNAKNTYSNYTIATNTWSATTPSTEVQFQTNYENWYYLPVTPTDLMIRYTAYETGNTDRYSRLQNTYTRLKYLATTPNSSSIVPTSPGIDIWGGASATWFAALFVPNFAYAGPTEANMLRYQDGVDIHWQPNFVTGQSQWIDWRVLTQSASAKSSKVVTQFAGTIPADKRPPTTTRQVFRNAAGDKWYCRNSGSIWQLDDQSKLIPYSMP